MVTELNQVNVTAKSTGIYRSFDSNGPTTKWKTE